MRFSFAPLILILFFLLSLAKLKSEYHANQAEKAESYLGEITLLDREDTNVLFRSLAAYVLVSQNLGNVAHSAAVRETMGESLASTVKHCPFQTFQKTKNFKIKRNNHFQPPFIAFSEIGTLIYC